MIVHPTNPDIAYAAVLGNAVRPQPRARRLPHHRRRQDLAAGARSRTPTPAPSDVCFDPHNPRILFAGAVAGAPPAVGADQRRPRQRPVRLARRRRHLEAAQDRGRTACPPGPWGKVGVAVAPVRQPARLRADRGREGRPVPLRRRRRDLDAASTTTAHLRQRAWYFSHAHRRPDERRRRLVPAGAAAQEHRRRQDVQARARASHHGDHHDLWIDPKNPKRMIDANDGGVDITTNGGETWYAPPLPIASSTTSPCDNRVPYRVMGHMQDLGTASGPSNSLSSARHPRSATGTPSAAARPATPSPDPTDPNIVYAGEYGGYHHRATTTARGQARNVSIYPYNPSGHGAEDLTLPLPVDRPDPRSRRTTRRRSTTPPTCSSAPPTAARRWADDQPAT